MALFFNTMHRASCSSSRSASISTTTTSAVLQVNIKLSLYYIYNEDFRVIMVQEDQYKMGNQCPHPVQVFSMIHHKNQVKQALLLLLFASLKDGKRISLWYTIKAFSKIGYNNY